MQFARKLTLFDATMIVISGVIGSGIFINPYLVANAVKTAPMILAVWLTGGLVALAGAFVFAELATVMPKVGGQYAFFREAFHPLVAFLHGWSLLLIIQSGATAAVAMAFAQYWIKLFNVNPAYAMPLAVAILLGLTAFHALGIKPGAILLNVVTFGKTLAIAALIIGAFVLTQHSSMSFTPFVPANLSGGGLLSAFFAGMVPTMFCYGGGHNLNFVAEEVKDPERTMPRALLIGTFCIIAIYVSANIAYLHVLGAENLAATTTPAADVARQLAGRFGEQIISALIVVSTFGFINLGLMAAPRVYYAMGADGVFFKALGQLSPRFQVPTAAIVLQGVLAALFALSNRYDKLVSYAVFADWIYFALAGLALMVFRRTLPKAPRPMPAPLYPLTPLFFTLMGLGIVANEFIANTSNAVTGAAIIAGGVPIYFLWQRFNKV